MCLTLPRFYETPRYATKDIVCYKVGVNSQDDTFKSAIFGKTYKKGETYKSVLRHTSVIPLVRNDSPFFDWLRTICANQIHQDIIELGLHTFANEPDSLKRIPYFHTCIYKCVIPKGSWYYKGYTGYGNLRFASYASDTLKICEKIR